MIEIVTRTIHLREDLLEKKVINSENRKEALRKSYPLRSSRTEPKTVNIVTKASNTFHNTTVNERYQQQSNMQSKKLIPTWQKHSKEISNTREYSKAPKIAKPNALFSKGNSNGYSGRMEDKNNAIAVDALKRCANENNDHRRGFKQRI